MNTKNIALSAVLALAAFSGSAFAAGQMPESGAGPLFLDEASAPSMVSRAQVAAAAAADQPLAGNVPEAVVTTQSQYTRAEVRAQVREAIARGYHVQSGDQS